MDLRKRLTATLFSGAALGSTGYIAAATVSTLAVADITGRATLAGVPGAVAVVGTALGTSALSIRASQRGRRPGLMIGYGIGAIGALLATWAVIASSLPLLLTGMAALGVGHASNQLARYTGAEMYPAENRASALSIIVWAGTIGSVLGPSLLKPAGAIASGQGTSDLAGGYGLALGFMTAAMILYGLALRPDPIHLSSEPSRQATSTKGSLGGALARPQVRVALAAMISGQVVMVLIMTATPLHIRHFGADLGTVGIVMSAHTLGMFAFSPLTGRLVDRFGHYSTILAGLVVLATSAVLAVAAPNGSTVAMVVALWLLGLGWNFGFVAGSALLTVGLAPDIRVLLQGRADSITWASSAVASLFSGVFFELTDYRMLALVGLAMLAVPAIVVARNRSAVRLAPI